jgi:DNA-binding transcriptional LysR family regulator
MDVTSARTFLAIVDTGNFNRTSEIVNVTQSTVSARIKSLEESLGQKLFVRSKTGVTLTGAGKHFVPHAQNIVRSWEQARHDVALPENYRSVIVLGGQFSLWDSLLSKWVSWLQQALPDIALRTEVGSAMELMRMLQDGQIDVALMYSPQHRTGVEIELLSTDSLVLFSSSSNTKGPGEKGYIYVDWGPEFQSSYIETFPEIEPPVLAVSHGPMGLQHITEHGGAGFFPENAAHDLVESGKLFRVSNFATFSRSVYVAYRQEKALDEVFNTSLQGVKYVASLSS